MPPDTAEPFPWWTVTKDYFLGFLFFHDSPNWILALPCICHVSFLGSTRYILYSSGLLSFCRSLQGLLSASNGGACGKRVFSLLLHFFSTLKIWEILIVQRTVPHCFDFYNIAALSASMSPPMPRYITIFVTVTSSPHSLPILLCFNASSSWASLEDKGDWEGWMGCSRIPWELWVTEGL